MIPIRARKLIPRLASPYDGEVVETARALGRALKSDGLDLHDLARMANSAPLVRDRDLPESETAKRARTQLKEILTEGWLDPWSTEFAESILERRNLDLLSEKQLASLTKILRRADIQRQRAWSAPADQQPRSAIRPADTVTHET